MYMPMFIVLSLSCNLGVNPVDLPNITVVQTSPYPNECVLLNTEENAGVLVSYIIEENIIETTNEETVSEIEEVVIEDIVSCIGCFNPDEEIIHDEIIEQVPAVNTNTTIENNTIEQTEECAEPNNNYHEVDVPIPSILEDEEVDIERNNNYHDINIQIPSIYKQ